jgi:hypothetical protein
MNAAGRIVDRIDGLPLGYHHDHLVGGLQQHASSADVEDRRGVDQDKIEEISGLDEQLVDRKGARPGGNDRRLSDRLRRHSAAGHPDVRTRPSCGRLRACSIESLHGGDRLIGRPATPVAVGGHWVAIAIAVAEQDQPAVAHRARRIGQRHTSLGDVQEAERCPSGTEEQLGERRPTTGLTGKLAGRHGPVDQED